tara:strand:+ start:2001 stop:3131 length:1131 start_codon:yes stop_codon:yes gene_type:complete
MKKKNTLIAILFFTISNVSAAYIDKLNLPKGFNISIYADELPLPRQIAESESGYIFFGSKVQRDDKGRIHALIDKDKDGYAEEKIIVAEDLDYPTGVSINDGNLYFSEIDKIWVIKDIESWLDKKSLDLPIKELVTDNLPSETWHGYKYIDFGPDNNIYVSVGAPCNVCTKPQEKDKRFAAIHRYVDGELIPVAKGVRNSVGFDWNPETKKLYFTDNGRDWLGDNSPSCELNIVNKEGSFYGFPYKHAKNIIDPEFGELIPSIKKEFVDPIAELGPHVAPLGMVFYDNNKFPQKYKNSIFVALHGSWNRTKKSGYKIVFIKLDEEGNYMYQEDFITGWLINENAWGRPVSPFIMSDGSMLISDDKSNVIYRVTYSG